MTAEQTAATNKAGAIGTIPGNCNTYDEKNIAEKPSKQSTDDNESATAFR